MTWFARSRSRTSLRSGPTRSRLAVAVLVATLALAAPVTLSACSQQTAPVAGPATGASTVTTVDAAQFLTVAEAPGTVVVDVRTPQEYAAGHVKGSVNIDVENRATFDTKIAELNPAGTYAVYCRSGNRSTVASDAMVAAGFTGVVNLSGGLTDLEAAGAELER